MRTPERNLFYKNRLVFFWGLFFVLFLGTHISICEASIKKSAKEAVKKLNPLRKKKKTKKNATKNKKSSLGIQNSLVSVVPQSNTKPPSAEKHPSPTHTQQQDATDSGYDSDSLPPPPSAENLKEIEAAAKKRSAEGSIDDEPDRKRTKPASQKTPSSIPAPPLPPPLPESTTSQKSPKKPVAQAKELKSGTDTRSDLLKQIQKGKALKKVPEEEKSHRDQAAISPEEKEKREKERLKENSGSLTSILSEELDKKAPAHNYSSSEESGSDADSESDAWSSDPETTSKKKRYSKKKSS